jgi:hypothetical protein
MALGGMAGKSVDQIGSTKPPSGNARAEKLMSPNAQERPDTQTGSNDLKQWIGKNGKPSGPFGQRGRI